MNSIESAKDILKNELILRKKKNSKYSLRSFAQTLGVSPAYISLLFSGERRLTQVMAKTLGRKLGWNSQRLKYFSLLAEFETSKSDQDKIILLQELQRHTLRYKQTQLVSLDAFSLIYEWQHSAILALLTLPKARMDCEFISRRLNISKVVCEESLLRLERLRLVGRSDNGGWQSAEENFSVASIPSQAIRCYHKEILRKALVAIDKQDFSNRDFTNFVFTVDPKNLPLIKEKIKNFKNELAQLAEQGKLRQLYQFSTQLFRIDVDEKENSNDYHQN